MDLDSPVFVAGHLGLVGSAILRCLQAKGYSRILTRTHRELDLLRQDAVEQFFREHRPRYVFLAAARVGGIRANWDFAGDFIRENLLIQTNVIHEAYRQGAEKLLFLGSSCIYPKLAPQPLKEEYLLTSQLEPTNESYAVAKIAGIKMCEAYNRQYGTSFMSVMPTNLYGPNDNFDLQTSHVLPALIRKFHEAKAHHSPEVTLWGTGKARQEFLYVDDLAEACVLLMQKYGPADFEGHVNIGCGKDLTISELAQTIAHVVGYGGKFVYDTTTPDGTPQKLLDITRITRLGWAPRTSLVDGLRKAYASYLASLLS